MANQTFPLFEPFIKRADPTADAFSGVVRNMESAQLNSDAFKDIKHLFLASLGAGLAGRGAVGLFNTFGRNQPKKPRSGPATFTLPYPAEPKVANWLDSVSNFAKGDSATSKSGIPWYTPAMLGAGMAGAGLGWKGLDVVLEKQRNAEREKQLNQARQQFHDALMSQYSKPVSTHPDLLSKIGADVPIMEKVGEALDAVWQKFEALLDTTLSKEAFDFGNAAGAAAGGYGAYAGLSGLMAGAFIYDKIKKRSRGAILDKAMQRRRRREFMQRPTELTATPEPMLSESPGISAPTDSEG
jgi:hypothetical protein